MQKLAQDYRRNAQQCQDIANFLKSPLATMFWQSQAATSFRDNINEYTRVLNNFQEAFTGLSTDVDARWRALEASGNR
ncbi:MAG: WXG100 family type VII secretion target [Chloroflexi bacterium]|nr:WXG100 family type VII secretion target [Chloroflexota bacterium]